MFLIRAKTQSQILQLLAVRVLLATSSPMITLPYLFVSLTQSQPLILERKKSSINV